MKNVGLNSVLHTLESKEFLISVPCLTERGLKVKFSNVSSVIPGQHSVEGTAKRVNQMYDIEQYDDSAYVVTSSDIHL